MTLEEKAEEYADKHAFRVPYDGSNNFYDEKDYKASKEGFLVGFTEGRKEKWHDLRKDPNDLPKDNEYVLIYTDLKNTYVARIPTGKDYFITRTGGFIQGSAVIAWCELPKFEE